MATIKMNKAQKFHAIEAMLSGADIVINDGKVDAEGNSLEITFTAEQAKEFIAHEIELLEKKNSAKGSKPKGISEETQTIMNDVIAYMVPGEIYRAKDISKAIPSLDGYATQKATSVLGKLVSTGLVENFREKGVSYFRLVEEG